ncbi:hypothetical protein VHUM_03951 [Vanrija humicola]|uniref:Major facilitator superfamily (MFS) profile domain-containing protein n=1 Tax=Vanrija humicola TaxID=5417 RepID=A0A7D8UZ77_VANHU|nr:hypothetical protein VHUM_03951 [Vanrija humicola]
MSRVVPIQALHTAGDIAAHPSTQVASPGPTDVEAGSEKEATRDADSASLASAEIEQGLGVTKIEALYLVFGKGWKLFLLWFSVGLIAFAYSLSQSTTYVYAQFATSSFGEHTLVGTIAVVTGIMAGVCQPFIAKMADLFSRPIALSISVFCYTLGYIIIASAGNIKSVVAGQVIATLGQTGIYQIQGILVADITNLKWRGFVNGLYSLPFILNAFIAGFITSGINGLSENGWRWGYGMFCILIPVCLMPSLFILFWGDRRAKKLGALSLASSSYARRQILERREPVHRTLVQNILHHLNLIDAFGLLVLGFAFACLLAPGTLSTSAKGGYKNPSLIAMYCVGAVLFVGFMFWEFKYAAHPIMPRRVMNRTFLCCIAIDFLYFFTGYLTDAYYMSYVYIIKPEWSDKNYTYFGNTLTVGLCLFAVVGGAIQRYTKRYKALQISGLVLRVLGEGITFLAVNGNQKDVTLVMGRVLISMGGGITVTSTGVASAGSVPHADMALAMAILSLWTQLGGSVASAISGAIWNRNVPRNLEKYLGNQYNATQRAEIFGSILVARTTEPHDLVNRAYTEAIRPLYIAALCTCFLALVAGFLTKEFYLGDAHNTIETNKEIKMRSNDETTDEAITARVAQVEAKIEDQMAKGN